MRDDLLRAEREERGLPGGEAEGLVPAVRVKGLRAPQNRREGLEGDPDDVGVGLPRREGGTRGLGVEAEHTGFGLLGAEALAHDARPHAAGRPKLRDLFKEVAGGIEEECRFTYYRI